MRNSLNRQVQQFITQNHINKVLVICDEKLLELYPDYFYFQQNDTLDTHFFIYPLESDEETKVMNTVMRIFDFLLENKFEKDSLVLSWGGGIISDIAGFVAAFFKRGVKLIHIPTTLLAMVDAAHGGKNGVNFHNIKNALGSIYFPEKILIDTDFLQTLPDDQFLNGYAEFVKSTLIGIPELWNTQLENVTSCEISNIRNSMDLQMIQSVIDFKNEIVALDPQDTAIRKILNFGHTIGHALESVSFSKGEEMAHGKAVAIGIYYEVELSFRMMLLPETLKKEIQGFLSQFFPIPFFTVDEATQIADFTLQDKKNSHGEVQFTLLNGIGSALFNQPIPYSTIIDIFCHKPL